MKKITKTLCVILSLLLLVSALPFASADPSGMAQLETLTQQRIAEIRATGNTDISAVTGTVYYVSAQNGNDENDGKSPDTAWQTYSKAASFTYNSGDAVLFERGGIYRGHWNVSVSLLIGSYGTGAKPRLYGSTDAATGSWTAVAENIWMYSADTVYDIGNIIFEGDRDNLNATWGHKVTNYKNGTQYTAQNIGEILTSDLQFYSAGYATASQRRATKLYLYSETNPNERFSQLELCETYSIIRPLTSNITVDNLELRYTGGHAINGGTMTGLTVTNCEFGFIGGGMQTYEDDGRPIRYGNAVEIYGTPTDYTVTNCYVWQVYDAGLTPQYTATKESRMKNILFNNNVIEYCNYSIEYWNSSEVETSIIENFRIENNIMRYAGQGICTERPDKNHACHIKTWANADRSRLHLNKAEGFVISGNIFADCDGQMGYIYADDKACMPVFENNTFLQKCGGGGFLISESGDGAGRTVFTPALLQSIFGDTNSFAYSDTADIQSGSIGGISWRLDLTDGSLIIGGEGELTSAPWSDFAENITSAAIGEGITGIASTVFKDCINLTSMSFEGSPSYLSGSYDNIVWAFTPADGSLTIGGSGAIPSFEAYGADWSAFAPAVKTLTIGENITAIGNYAFYGLVNLGRLYYNPVTCAALTKDSANGNNGANFSFSYCGSNTKNFKVTIGENVTAIPDHLFRVSSQTTDAPRITEIEFAGNKCLKLGNHCFRALSYLEKITLPENLQRIGTFALGSCTRLKELTIPASVKYISGYALMNSTNLESLTFEGSVSSMDSTCMLTNSYRIKTVSLPEGLKAIGERTFRNCPVLTQVSIPSTVTKIGKDAFLLCPALTKLFIPATVTEITDGSVGYLNASTKQTGFVIQCYTGSAAYSYALANGFEIEIMDHYGHTEQTVTTPSTCTTAGKVEIICSCGKIISEEALPLAGHIPETLSAKEPTCTQTGLTEGSACSVCGLVITAQQTVEKAPHTPATKKGRPATCTATGLTDGTVCSVCGLVITAQQTVEKAPHTPVSVNGRPATCTSTGLTDGTVCGTCGIIIKEQEAIPALSHADTDGNGSCDTCGKQLSGCSCNCHKTGFMKFIFRVILFFQKLAGSNKTCKCGAAHY